MTENSRGSFGSKIGLILATAGGAVGLGNVWRFPYMAGQEGGAAFILVYIGCVLLLGIPCMISEFIIGRHGASNTARAYTKVANGNSWKWIGYLEVLTGFLITGYYAVVSGWCLQYVYASIMGELHGDPTFVANYFKDFSSDPIRPVMWTVVIFLICHFVIGGQGADFIAAVHGQMYARTQSAHGRQQCVSYLLSAPTQRRYVLYRELRGETQFGNSTIMKGKL